MIVRSVCGCECMFVCVCVCVRAGACVLIRVVCVSVNQYLLDKKNDLLKVLFCYKSLYESAL